MSSIGEYFSMPLNLVASDTNNQIDRKLLIDVAGIADIFRTILPRLNSFDTCSVQNHMKLVSSSAACM